MQTKAFKERHDSQLNLNQDIHDFFLENNDSLLVRPFLEQSLNVGLISFWLINISAMVEAFRNDSAFRANVVILSRKLDRPIRALWDTDVLPITSRTLEPVAKDIMSRHPEVVLCTVLTFFIFSLRTFYLHQRRNS